MQPANPPTTGITRAVIPAAGLGTRMLPAAKSIPKEMLPVLDRPAIQYVVEEAADAGIDDLLLVTSREKKAIEDHFDRNPELEQRLARTGRSQLLASVNQLIERVQIHAVRQRTPLGLGDAVMQARRHVGDQPFLCLLGDTIFSRPTASARLPGRQLLDAWRSLGTPIIALEHVPPEKAGRYGIIGGKPLAPDLWSIDALVEKPAPDAAPSAYAICARYVLTPDIFDCLDQTPPGKGGEIQLTDALQRLLQRRPIHGIVLEARRHDIGNPVDWLRTNLVFAARDEAVWGELAGLLRSLMS